MSVSESGVRPILAEAAEPARRALLELQPTGVGEHLGVTGEDEYAATHRFAATLPGYHGWQWEVVVAAAPGATYATVSESALLPGPDALIAPDFVPWEQRVRPGDLAPGDLLAPRADDERLVPGYVASGDPATDEVCAEIGLGRRQVLSREGRVEAAERWYSEFGPGTDMARSAPGTCGVCGFFVPLAGSLRAAFGVCANALGADGRVEHVEYGCGAHSDTEIPTGAGSPRYEPYDDAAVELIPASESRRPTEQSTEPASAPDESPAVAGDPVIADSAAGEAAPIGEVPALASANGTAAKIGESTGTESAPDTEGAATTAPVAEADIESSTAAEASTTGAAQGENTGAAGTSGHAPAERPTEAEAAGEN